MNALENFLGKHSQEASVREVLPNFDTLEPEVKLRFRHLWSNRKKNWANYALHVEFNIECNNKWCGMCGFHSSVEIAYERAEDNQ